MRRLFTLLAAFAVSVAFLFVAAPGARADENDSVGQVSAYHQDVKVAVDGTATVTLDLEYDFGNQRAHGPFIALVTKMRVPNDPDHWRNLPVEITSVTSPSGAPAKAEVKRESQAVVLKVGVQGRQVSGKQTYRVVYTIRGLIQPGETQSGGGKLDEFNWNAVGGGWQVPLSNVKVTLTGPAAASKAACFSGPKTTTPCQAEGTNSTTVTYAVDHLRAGEAMQVVAGFPVGTFKGAEPTFSKRYTIGNMFPVTPVTAIGGGLVALAGGGAVLAGVRRHGRDQAYLGLAPGMVPVAGDAGTVGTRQKAPVAVAFQPPKGATPGEVGTLIDGSADNTDVTATIVDLAVRGHLTITPGDGKGKFTMVRHSSPDQLRPYEAKILSTLFGGSDQITQKDLAKKSRATLLPNAREGLYTQVTSVLHWFRMQPALARGMAIAGGVVLLIAAAVVGGTLGLIGGWGVIGLGLAIPGLLLIALNRRISVRTPAGSAVLAQAKGFELYLTTAEADQIKFEEGVDVFSRYLPYAMVFGVTDRWVKVFEKLAAEGRYQADLGWYGSHNMGMIYGMSLASSFDALTQSMSSSMNQAIASANASSASSSGGSGFSGGGGFGGGGGGSW